MPMLKKTCHIIVTPLLVVLGLAILLPVIPFLILTEYIRGRRIKSRLRKFCKEKAGSSYLVCTRRSGWFEFIVNNVMPILPPNVSVVWPRRDRGQAVGGVELLLHWTPEAYGVSKPYLMALSPDGVKIESIHEDLVKLKGSRRKDRETQQKARKIVEDKLAVQ